ncbi:MAG: VOC family protein [Gemmatimonadaceae bacterium]
MPAISYSLRALAPVLIVDAVEPGVAFWTEALGFVQENAVPGDDGKLVFASVKKDGVEIMYQTRASVLADDPSGAADLSGHSTALFITVPTMADLDAIEARTSGAPVVKPRHDTFYGSTEFYVREPGGNVVGFAAFNS